jgi:hypothetical protein
VVVGRDDAGHEQRRRKRLRIRHGVSLRRAVQGQRLAHAAGGEALQHARGLVPRGPLPQILLVARQPERAGHVHGGPFAQVAACRLIEAISKHGHTQHYAGLHQRRQAGAGLRPAVGECLRPGCGAKAPAEAQRAQHGCPSNK